jgi:purine-binding chemotaxis protein CheW
VNTGHDEAAGTGGILAIVARAASRLCAIPLEHAVEIMRVLPIEPVADAPPFVTGLAIIRGAPVPVVDLAALLGGAGEATRLILLRVGDRRVAVAVAAVIGVQRLDHQLLAETPPLLQVARADLIESVGVLDAQLLVVLRASRLVPEDAWHKLELGRA